MDELKPCPFCGSEVEMTRHYEFLVICKNPDCRESANPPLATESMAIAAWNRRTEAKVRREVVTREEILGAMGIGTARWRDESWDNPAKKESQFQAEAIHAHLLANARESLEAILSKVMEKYRSLGAELGDDGLYVWSRYNELGELLKALATVGKDG